MSELNQHPEVLQGARTIADYLGFTERQVRHHYEHGRLPLFKLGTTLCARRSTLTQWLADLEAQARKPDHDA